MGYSIVPKHQSNSPYQRYLEYMLNMGQKKKKKHGSLGFARIRISGREPHESNTQPHLGTPGNHQLLITNPSTNLIPI